MIVSERLMAVAARATALALALAFCGCVGPGGRTLGGTDLAVVAPAQPDAEPTREEVVAELRAEAEAQGDLPYPAVFAPEQRARLAARPEPRSMAEVAAIQEELTLIAKQRASGASDEEIAALEERRKELLRLMAAAQNTPLRR